MIDIETLKEYIKVLEDCSLAEIEISDEEDSIRLAKPSADSPVAVLSAQGSAPQAPAAAVSSAPAASGNAIKSPMVGVFYSAPAPDRPPFVSVGDTVNKGDVVCIIEAMKIMNEITADKSGTITEILVENGDVVEYDQPLFNIG
ncbi:MAG: acetyl-CoA carboxylase biotin carboxyl carrier protein [Ruminococcus sp.]|nr:acetyl-CoA carboxylase biotin carboxyl carrier protein [Ruminococcus sp.]